MFVFVCVCCVSLLHLSYVSDFIRFLLGQYLVLYSALLSCLDYCLLIDFFLCYCPWQIKIHSFIHSFIQCESLCPVSPTSLEICMCGFRFTKFTKFLGEVKMVPPLRYPKTKKLSDPPTRGSAHGPRWGLRPPDSRAFSSSKFATTPLVTGPSVLRGNWRYEQMPVPNSPFCFQYAVLL